GEGAAYAENLLINGITHAMRGVAQRARAADEALRREPRASQRVDQVEVDRKIAAVLPGDSPHHDIVAAGGLPVGRRDLIGTGGCRRHALARQRAEAPAPLEVVLHDACDIYGAVAGAGLRERHDRDRYRVAYAGSDLDLQVRARLRHCADQ